MATVYLARDEKHGRMVAIKVLRPELGASIGIDRFLREIRTAAQLQHPNILALYDSGEADGLLFYVMPFVEGESLRDRLHREKQLPIEDAVMLVHEAADALHFAHQHGVVHRDIKPENILIQGGHALVADFGIARAFSEAGGEKLTQTGMAIGTPHYMSPEQGMGGDVDGRSDVYSLGCVLYELLVGQPPFDGPNAMAILARHSMEAVPAISVVRKTVPEDLEAVVEESLEKSAADRFQTAEAFSEALLSVDLSHVTRRHAIPRVTMSRVAARKKQRRKSMMLGGAGLAVLVAGAVVGVLALKGSGGGGRRVAAGLDPTSIAVLYFDSRGGGDSLQHVADGLTEALIGELSGVKGLKTISRNGVRPYRGTSVTPDSIGRALQAGTLVTGTLSQSGDRLRLDVTMHNGNSGDEVAQTRLESTRSEIFALQDTLAGEVSRFLRENLRQEVRLVELRLGTRNRAAWELAQKATAAFRDAESLLADRDTAAARRQYSVADSLFLRAASEDKRWVAPVSQRAWVLFRQCRTSAGMDKVQNDQCTRNGLELADAAVALDSTNADAREIRGTLRYWRFVLNLEPDANRANRLRESAEADLRASVGANPQQSTAWNILSHLMASKAELAEAKLAAQKAYESDPYLTGAPLALWRLFSYALDTPDPDPVQVNHWCQEGERRFPSDPRFVECRLMINTLPNAKPDIRTVWDMLDRYVELSPVPLRETRQKRGEMIVAMVLARAGLKDSARSVAERARAPLSLDPNRELVYLEAIVLGISGDNTAAFGRLKEYVAAFPQQAANFDREVSWMTRELRADPRWKQLSAMAK
jgi:serine/threonine-protein kinase